MADRRRLWKRVRQIWVATGITATVAFVTWSLIAYRASAEAISSLHSDSSVRVTHAEGVWQIVPNGRQDARHAAFVFFPGALVDPRAYAPLARAVASAGYAAYIVELPRRGAFGGATAPEVQMRLQAALQGLNESVKVVIGGHSRGAVVASQMVSQRPADFAGLILIGTSHPRDADLSSLDLPVVKIVGTRDGLATRPEVQQNAAKLPSSTRWIWVEGGNHSQFGWYGFQPGDWTATIEASEQRQRLIDAVLTTLRDVDTHQRRNEGM